MWRKITWWCGKKKSSGLSLAAAAPSALLSSKIAPSTLRSASMLWGGGGLILLLSGPMRAHPCGNCIPLDEFLDHFVLDSNSSAAADIGQFSLGKPEPDRALFHAQPSGNFCDSQHWCTSFAFCRKRYARSVGTLCTQM